MERVTLACGNGASENNALIQRVFFKHFENQILIQGNDSAILPSLSKMAFSTDSYTISPLFFAGGDIGKLSICGTCNDLTMMGARPKYLSASFIIEEGFELKQLEKIAQSMAEECRKNGVLIVTGDTKVVGRGHADGIYINTAGIGEVIYEGLNPQSLQHGDVIIVSNSIGKHGASIFSQREGIDLVSHLYSDCASLFPLVQTLFQSNLTLRALRDATRGGLAAVLNEWARSSQTCICIDEKQVPISDEVQGICEFLGLEAYALANEGTFVLALPKSDALRALEILHSHPLGKEAQIIGEVGGEYKQRVILDSGYGTRRFLDMPSGEILPRIC
ncbi:hydrogenase expression/formation protein HypE [Helicobacter kayseriensis]|uniref:hydrogenase expression/formation protein HypE n=1 Tax=Helicobacter kayseriensis TaxID=2905877 RepID=UPI001E33A182|nr:hydrogenase expression/formation protein HypE [Helicobacter kayseriensis]MCE3046829.1 hydrogenase expression/formation protein HypE [Helicobacter kayseriensis]MCE3047869.1 hydrogenase expression/formation protein HypE [Helicobacter kayseriensis]